MDKIGDGIVRTLRVLLSACLLCAGCSYHASVTRNEILPDDKTAFFYLHDGSCIRSNQGGHSRKEGGYYVKGEFATGAFRGERIEGMCYDGEIKDIKIEEVDTSHTVLGIVAASSIVLLVVFGLYLGAAGASAVGIDLGIGSIH